MEGRDPAPGEDDRVKSILKPRSKPSGNSLKGKVSNTAGYVAVTVKSKDVKKRVEITTPPHSNTSLKGKINYKETPLPRVALLPPRPTNLEKLRPKPKTFLSHRESSLKRSVGHNSTPIARQTPAKASASTSNLKSIPGRSSGAVTGIASPRRNRKSTKKKIKKKKSKSTPNLSAVVPPRNENGGKEYIKELVTINELLKSVTDAANQENQGAPLIEGFIRPFSAGELHQLIASVGKVATIHQDPASLTPQIHQDEPKKKNVADDPSENGSVVPNAENSSTTKGKKKKARKSKKIPKTKSSFSTNTKNSKNQEHSLKSVPAKGSANKNLASKKTLKSSVKTLKAKSKKNSSKDNAAGEELGSELSELDLVKSAILNKRYYEESLALEHQNSKEDLQTENKSSSHKLSSKKKLIKDLRRLKAAHNSAHELISPTGSRSSSPVKKGKDSIEDESFKSGTVGRSIGPLPLPPFRPNDVDGSYSKALENVLINYSHVIRPPTRRGLEHFSSKTKLENREVVKLDRLLESDGDHDNTPEFEKHMKNLKYRGPVERGMLDIGHVKVSNEPPPVGTYTKNGHPSSNTDIPSQKELQEQMPKPRRSHRRNRKSQSPSRQEPKAPVTAPTIGYHGPFTTPEKKMRNIVRGGELATHTSPLSMKLLTDPSILNLVKPHPSRWNEQSIAPSLFVGLPDNGASRWTILNERILEKNREMGNEKNDARPKGARYSPEGLNTRVLGISPVGDRKLILENLDKAKKAFDNFGVHNNVMDRKHFWKPGKAQYANIANTFGFETLAKNIRK